ncbi:MAG: ABC transporter permease [Thermomicrobiales bacterium]
MAVAGSHAGTLGRVRAGRAVNPLWLSRLRQNLPVMLAVGLLAGMAILSIVSEAVGAPDALDTNPKLPFADPSRAHWFGTDELGRDLFARVVVGARTSLATSAVVVLASALVGIPVGLLAGYIGGVADTLLMRLVDVILAFPAILLAMGLIAVLGQGFLPAIVAVSVVSIPGFARLMRASVLAEKEREYVLAARAIGCAPGRLMLHTLLPNCLAPVIVQAAFIATWAVLLEASLSFLGFGVRPPTPSWGQMLSMSKDFLYRSPWYGLFPGAALTLVVLALYTLGDAAQRALGRGRQSLF